MSLFREWTLVAGGDRARSRVEEDDVGVRYDGGVGEVEHVRQRPGDAVEGASADALAGEEDVFDEAGDGALVGDGGVNGVLLGPGGDNQERLTRPIATTALSVKGGGAQSRQSRGGSGGADADTCSIERV